MVGKWWEEEVGCFKCAGSGSSAIVCLHHDNAGGVLLDCFAVGGRT